MSPFSHARRAFIVGLLVPVAIVTATGSADHRSFDVQVTGTGRPVIFIPGFASSGDTWKAAVDRYRDWFACHVVTLAGFAGVPPIDQPLLSSVRRELAEYIRIQKLDRPIIVCHSLGGTLTLALAADHPELVGPLVIVDGFPFMAGASFQTATLEEARPRIAAMHAYMSNLTAGQYEESVRSGAATSFMVTKPADLDLLKQWGPASDRRTAADAMAELYDLDLRKDIGRITTPTLVLGTWIGLHDQLAKYNIDLPRDAVVRTFAKQSAEVPQLHFALSETARHFIMFDDRDWFFRELDAFMTDPAGVVRTRVF